MLEWFSLYPDTRGSGCTTCSRSWSGVLGNGRLHPLDSQPVGFPLHPGRVCQPRWERLFEVGSEVYLVVNDVIELLLGARGGGDVYGRKRRLGKWAGWDQDGLTRPSCHVPGQINGRE